MGTFLKYLFYLILIIVIYLVGKGIYDGSIDKQTTVGSVVEQVDTGAKQMAKDAGNAIDSTVDQARDTTRARAAETSPAATGQGTGTVNQPTLNPAGTVVE